MKKFLVFNQGHLKANTGGPSGYLYILKSYFDNQQLKNIELNSYEKSIENENSFLSKTKQAVKKTIPEFFTHLSAYYKIMSKKEYKINLDDYSGIHFHSTIALYKWNDYEKFDGKILLTSHSPKYYYSELLEDDKVLGNGIIKKVFGDRFKRIDREAFSKADYLIMPCEQALEIYRADKEIWSIIESKKKNNQIKYVPTGLIPKKILPQKDFFKDKQIPEGSFVISFIGRHIPVKGYDLLQKFAEKIIPKYNNVYFVIAGNINKDYPPLNNEQWVEYGWTDKSFEIIKNSNLFILPNRQTYFDLVLLEVLSMGTPVMLSDTGGNKYFHKYKEKGLFFFENDNVDHMISRFEALYKLWEDDRLKKFGDENKKLFDEEFTVETFGKRYVEALKDIEMI